MLQYVFTILLALCTLQSKAQTTTAQVEQAMRAICEESKLMEQLCGNTVGFNKQLIVFPYANGSSDKETFNFLCQNYSIWITTPSEAFFRDLSHNFYFLVDWVETEVDINFSLVPNDSPNNSANSTFKISLIKSNYSLKIESYQKLQ